MTDTDKAATIAALNDRLRAAGQSHEAVGRWMVTQGISALPIGQQIDIYRQIREFKNFEIGDDPHGERDFGAFDQPGVGKVFWKIDYYAPDMVHGSEDPADPTKTIRVLTVMLASEY